MRSIVTTFITRVETIRNTHRADCISQDVNSELREVMARFTTNDWEEVTQYIFLSIHLV